MEFCLEANPPGLGLKTETRLFFKSAPICENTMRIWVKHPGSETPLHWMGGSVLSWVSPVYFRVLTLQHQKSRKRQVLNSIFWWRIWRDSNPTSIQIGRFVSTMKTSENDAPLDLHSKALLKRKQTLELVADFSPLEPFQSNPCRRTAMCDAAKRESSFVQLVKSVASGLLAPELSWPMTLYVEDVSKLDGLAWHS